MAKPHSDFVVVAHLSESGFLERPPAECKKRFKYLAKMVKEKKKAAAAAAAAAAGETPA